jgi:hypothetical protein
VLNGTVLGQVPTQGIIGVFAVALRMSTLLGRRLDAVSMRLVLLPGQAVTKKRALSSFFQLCVAEMLPLLQTACLHELASMQAINLSVLDGAYCGSPAH